MIKVSNATMGRTEAETRNIMNFLHINYPGFKILNEKQYNVYKNGIRYEMDEPMAEGKTVRLEIGSEGLAIDVPIEALKKPNISVIPVYIAENTAIDLGSVLEKFKGQKVDYATPAQKVYSFENWEMRDGKVVVREKSMLNNDNIIIIQA